MLPEPLWWERKIIRARVRLWIFGYHVGTGWATADGQTTDSERSSGSVEDAEDNTHDS